MVTAKASRQRDTYGQVHPRVGRRRTTVRRIVRAVQGA